MRHDFDPDAPGTGEGIYGLPFTPDEAGVVLIPVPWDATTSYRPGAAKGPEAYRAHVAYLADDAREGRGLGTEGLDQSAEFIAREFRRAGLEPAGEAGTFFQAFSVKLKPELGRGGSLAVVGAAASPRQSKDFIPFPVPDNPGPDGDYFFKYFLSVLIKFYIVNVFHGIIPAFKKDES